MEAEAGPPGGLAVACAPLLGDKGKGLLSGNAGASPGHRDTDWHHHLKRRRPGSSPCRATPRPRKGGRAVPPAHAHP
ncbi:unnamed protein product, partial [Gulo gulo]